MMKARMTHLVRCIGLGLLLCWAGCTVGPEYQTPAIEMPDQWHQQLTDGFVTDESMPAEWWELLDDPILNDLIEQVRHSNPDMQSAYWTLVQARFARDYAAGDYYPVVEGGGAFSRTLYSSNSIIGGGISAKPFELYSLGFDAAWEPDIFGRVGRAVESAQASFEAQIENYRDVLVTLTAEAARNYVELRTVQSVLHYTLQNLQTQQDTLGLAEARFKSEIAPRLDVEQARLNLADTQSQIPILRTSEKEAINRLCVLTGRRPGELYDRLVQTAPVPVPPPQFAIQVPADLLRQRPDIRRAERQLAAQSARIGVATAELYPHFSLTGSIGFEAMDFSNLVDTQSKNYSFGPSFRWNLFNGGRIRNLIRIEESGTEALYWQYQSTVLAALEEVENAMTDYVQQQLRRQALEQSVDAARQSVQLVTTQYKNGLIDFQSVLILQRSLLLQEDKLAQNEGQIVQSLIRIYKALGGWGQDVLPSSVAEEPDPAAVQ